MAGTYSAKGGAMPQFDNTVSPTGSTEAGGMGKYKWYAIAAVGGLALIFYIRSRSSASTSTAGTLAANPTGTLGGSGVSSSGQASLDQINSQLGQILATSAAGSTAAAPTPAAPPQSQVGPDGVVIPSGNVNQDFLTQLQTSIGRTSPSLLSYWEGQGQNNELAALHAISIQPEAIAYQTGQWQTAHPAPIPTATPAK